MMRTIEVPEGYAVFIFRSPDDIAEAVAIQNKRTEQPETDQPRG
jgi:hypothetical protein